MARYRVPVSLSLVLCFLSYFATSRAFVRVVPVISKIEFLSNVEMINVSYTFHRMESQTDQSLDIWVTFKRPIKEMKCYFSYYATSANYTALGAIMKRTVDVCYYVRNPNSDRVVKIVYDYVMARSNLPKRCPFAAGDYQAHDIRPSDVKLPPFLPETTLMLEIVYRSEVRQETLIEFRIFGKLVRIINGIF